LAVQPLVEVSRWDRKTRRHLQTLCYHYTRVLGTNEKLIKEFERHSIQWRKPLSIGEINQMAPTPEVKRREGRP
jgi:hypothetical protein